MFEARRFTIKGRVQGVWFRDSTRRTALSLGLSGSATNLQNGDVEVLAFGEASALDDLANWLWQGPPLAAVSEVIVSAAEWQPVDGFVIN